MATADELLAALTDSGDNGVLLIDNDLRTIAIPKSIIALGVESDDDVHRLNFQMPRMCGDVDLSTFNIRINYMNAKNQGDIYVVTDKKVLSSTITFSWLVGPHAFAYKGVVRFIVCLKESDSSGNILREFNTTIASLPVLEGLEVDAMPLEGELVDVLEQLQSLTVEKVNEVEAEGSAQIAKVQQESTKQQDNIVEKGAQVLATIPAEYQTTVKLADEGVRTKADAITRTVEGKRIEVNDASDDNLRGLKLFGKTTQPTTTGQNLFNHHDIISNLYTTVEDDGTIYVDCDNSDGTSDKYVAFYTPVSNDLKVSTKYALVCEVISTSGLGEGIYLASSNGTVEISQFVDTPMIPRISVGTYIRLATTYDSFENSDYMCRGFMIIPSGTYVKSTIRMSILADTSVTADGFVYEPYTGGIFSPNPDFPQELVSPGVGKNLINVTVAGRNWIKYPYVETSKDLYGVKFVDNGDGSISISGTATANANFWFCYINNPIVVPDICTLSSGTENLSGKVMWTTNFGSGDAPRCDLNYTSDKFIGRPFGLAISVLKDATVNTTIYPMLNLGDTAQPWEPYKSIHTLPTHTPSGLPGIPVSSGGNHTDANGQQWICDEVDFARGMCLQRVAVLKNLDFSRLSNYDVNGVPLYTAVLPVEYESSADWQVNNGYCTHMQYKNVLNLNESGFYTVGKNLFVRIKDLNDDDAFLEAMSDSVFYTNINKPIETALTADELAAYVATKTAKTYTQIFSDSDVDIEASYNADTETYIDNKIAERTPRNHYVAPAITETKSGEVINVYDSSDDLVRGLKLFGKTTQNGTPSPESPVPLESVGDSGNIGVTVLGKNLFNKDEGRIEIVQGGTVYGAFINNGFLWAVPDASYSALIPCSPKTNYTLSGISGIPIVRIATMAEYTLPTDGAPVRVNVLHDGGNVEHVTITTGSEAKYIVLQLSSTSMANGAGELMLLEQGTAATAYEPYKEQTLTMQTPNGLPGIPVSSGGNYTDESGQQWICDEIDFARGVYVKRLNKIILAKTAVINYISQYRRGSVTIEDAKKSVDYTECAAKMNRFLYDKTVYSDAATNVGFTQVGATFWIRHGADTEVTDRASFDAWIDENPVEVLYILQTPTETPLTKVQLDAYRSAALHTNHPSTTIFNDANAGQEVTYVADTKNWIKNQLGL